MPGLKRVGDIEISQDLNFQKKEWMAERVGWVLMALIITAAALGLLGPGPLSKTTLENGPLQVTYFRFDRQLAPSFMELQVDPGTGSSGELRLRMDRKLLEAVEVEKVTPQPDQVVFDGDSLIYVFPVEDSSQPLKVTFNIQPDHVGAYRGKIGVDNGPEVDLRYFVLP